MTIEMQHLQPNTTLQGGKYRIERVLGQGGFGNTYVGYNTEFEETVAIKEFFMKGVTERDETTCVVSVSNADNVHQFEEQREKFKKEALRIRKLNNPHIVRVHDLFEENGTAYYVMDFVEGENLSQRLKRTGKPMAERKVREIFLQLLDALKAVHDAGMWHLDIKPANIMLDKEGNVKLIDFGASKQLNAQKGGATTSTAISYTNGYAPREQMEQNYDKFGPWTDIYALGATLYSLLTNKRPPMPSDIDDDISEDKHNALPFPATTSNEMKQLVVQMMQTNRMKRPQSIDAIIGAEKTRKIELKLTPKQKPTSQRAMAYDDEATIIAEPKSKKVEKKDELQYQNRENSNTNYQTTKQRKYTSSHIENNDNEGISKSTIIWIVAAIAILSLLNYQSCENRIVSVSESTPAPTETTVQKVERMQYTTAIGGCQYIGPVDEKNKPNGNGEAFFNDGRYYKGGFKHGIMMGDDCYFEYSNGDTFKGKFRYNAFYWGKYTIAKDKSFFLGSYKKGQPSKGTWYDKKGKVIERIKK